jgi:hypothetical protein
MTETTRLKRPAPEPAHAPRRPFVPARFAIATASAAAVNVVLFLIVSATGASMVITQPSETPLTLVALIVATIAPLVLAGVVTWFLARRWPVIRTVAAWAGVAVAVLSAPSPLFASADLATGIALGIMHIVAGVAWFIGILAPARAQSATPNPTR